MWGQVERILRQATALITDYIANFLPGLLVSLMLMLGAFVIALLARILLLRALRGLDFDRRVEQLRLAALVGWPASTSPSQTLARAVYWTILILGLLVSLTALNATIPSQLGPHTGSSWRAAAARNSSCRRSPSCVSPKPAA